MVRDAGRVSSCAPRRPASRVFLCRWSSTTTDGPSPHTSARANHWCRAVEPGDGGARRLPRRQRLRYALLLPEPTGLSRSRADVELRRRRGPRSRSRAPGAGWKLAQVTDQTEHVRARASTAWRVDDAPAKYVDQQLKAIVGVEIEVISIEGKAKLSQNRPARRFRSVRDNLASGSHLERNVAQRMDLMSVRTPFDRRGARRHDATRDTS